MGDQDLSFEGAITQLEDIVENLEEQDISLDQALEKYEQGVKLSKFCSDKLKQAEEKINIIRDEKGSIELENYTEEGN
jgi:exodeoxyribonuclease VII small subunit